MNLKTILLSSILLFGWATHAQSVEETVDAQGGKTRVVVEEAYREVDVLARYYGGYANVLSKVDEATKKCKKRKMRGKRKSAEVVVELLINRKGEVVEVNIINAEADFCNDAIVKSLQNSGKWIPALIDNKPVNSYLQLTINLQNSYNNNKINASSGLG